MARNDKEMNGGNGIMVNKNKATHMGECQICGRMQKLPNGRLAAHGYTVEHGWFNGICPGSGGLPFEQSFDLIEKNMERADEEADDAQSEADRLLSGEVDGNFAWVSHFFPAEYRLKGGYEWIKTVIYEEKKTIYDYSWNVHFYIVNNKRNVEERITIQNYGPHTTLKEMQVELNGKYATGFLKRRAESLRKYVAWQAKRIQDWKFAELTPIASETLGT